MTIKLFPYLFIFMAVSKLGFAQTLIFNKYECNLNFHYATILKHSSNMAQLANQHPWGLEINANRQTRGSKKWEQVYNYPAIGYSGYFFKMDPAKPLGNCYGIIFHIGNKIFKSSGFSYRVGLGPGFIFKTFDVNHNHRNNLISSKFNYCINTRLNYKIILKNNFNINIGLGLTHFSNGSIKVPNLGINIPSIHIGINYNNVKYSQVIKDSLSLCDRNTHLIFFTALGLKESTPVNGPKFLLSTFSINITKAVNRKSVINAGLEYFYDASPKRFLNDYTLNFKQLSKIGIVAGHELIFSNVSFLTQMGYYIYNPIHFNISLYQRFALKYYASKNIFFSVGLKTHFANADLVEWGIGLKK